MNSFHTHIQGQIQALLAELDRLTVDLSLDEFEKEPFPGSWSIWTILAHLNQTGREYLPRLIDARSRAVSVDIETVLPYRPTRMGRLFLKYLSPASKRKLPAPAKFKPARLDTPEEDIRELRQQFSQIAELVIDLHGCNFNTVKFGSPVTPLVRFSLADGFMVVVQHARRHMAQIERARNSIRPTDFNKA